jgi:hypothetical protein
MKKEQIYSIELLNSEGPILKAYKIGKEFVIQDEHKKLIGILNKDKMLDFLYDKMSLIDSKNRLFTYGEFPGSMKSSEESLREFLN